MRQVTVHHSHRRTDAPQRHCTHTHRVSARRVRFASLGRGRPKQSNVPISECVALFAPPRLISESRQVHFRSMLLSNRGCVRCEVAPARESTLLFFSSRRSRSTDSWPNPPCTTASHAGSMGSRGKGSSPVSQNDLHHLNARCGALQKLLDEALQVLTGSLAQAAHVDVARAGLSQADSQRASLQHQLTRL